MFTPRRDESPLPSSTDPIPPQVGGRLVPESHNRRAELIRHFPPLAEHAAPARFRTSGGILLPVH
jgi:hypothetical protein